jgi:hypothetical protein
MEYMRRLQSSYSGVALHDSKILGSELVLRS